MTLNGATLEVAVDLDYEKCGGLPYTVQVRAAGNGGTAASECTVDVYVLNQNDKPYFEAGPKFPDDLPEVTTFSVPERSEANTGVGKPIPVYDEDVGQELYFEIDSGLKDGSEGMFYIGSCSGQLYVKQDKTLDYATKKLYEIVVRVCDDPSFFDVNDAECSVEVPVNITVTDVNDVPYIEDLIVHFEVEENSNEGTKLIPMCSDGVGGVTETCTDSKSPAPVEGILVEDLDLAYPGRASTTDVMQYSIGRNDGNYAFTIVSCARSDNMDSCSGDTAGILKLSSSASLDFEEQSVYSIGIQVLDGRGGLVTKDYSVFVRDANDEPTMAPQSLHMPENDAASPSGLITAEDEDVKNGLNNLTFTIEDVNSIFEIAEPGWAIAGDYVTFQLKLEKRLTTKLKKSTSLA